MINNQADLKMLLICKTITENFAANISELSQVNPKWTDSYLVSISGRVDKAFDYYLGLETNREIEQVRNKLNSIQAQALRSVAFLKTRIEVVYVRDEKRKNQVLNTLGFKTYLTAIQEKDSEVLLELLGNIKENFTDEIKRELFRNQGDEAFVDRISEFAARLKKANLSQNSLMATKKAIAEDASEIFNNLLLEILEISEAVSAVYTNQPEKAKLFDYSFIARNNFVTLDH